MTNRMNFLLQERELVGYIILWVFVPLFLSFFIYCRHCFFFFLWFLVHYFPSVFTSLSLPSTFFHVYHRIVWSELHVLRTTAQIHREVWKRASVSTQTYICSLCCSFTASQKFLEFLEFTFSLPLDPILNHLHPVHNFTSCFCQIIPNFESHANFPRLRSFQRIRPIPMHA